MKMDRSVQRGKPLDANCKKAYITTHKYGPTDNRCFCYGLRDLMTDDVLPKCRVCGAWADNAKPPQKGV